MTQEFVTLPREVVDQAIAAMQRAGEQRGSTASEVVAMEAMRAALEQSTDNHDWYQLGFREGVVKGREELSAEYPLPADLYDSKDWRCGTYAERVEWLHTMYEDAKEQIAALEQPQNHVPDAGNMVPAGWKLVPVEPTIRQMAAMGPAIRACYNMDGVSGSVVDVYRAMLDAAPQSPEHYDQQALDLCPTCGWKTLIPGDCCLHCARQKPQVEQEPVALLADAIRSEPTELIHKWRVLELIQDHARQQPKREPLTDAQAKALLAELTGRDPACANDYNWDYELRIIRAIEAAHNIK